MVINIKSRCLIIAEAGVNHNGQLDYALDLVDAAADAGADIVKFQTFSAKNLVSPGTEKAEYQEMQTGPGDQFEMLKKLELSPEAHLIIYERCKERNIEFMSTPFDEEALEFLIKLGMKRVKIPSGEITNEPFLRCIAEKKLPIILSTGASTLSEVLRAQTVIQENHPLDLTILHCTSSYPADLREVNLRAMQTIAQHSKVPVGYSDHTLGISASVAAVALGAMVIEKHFTLDRGLPGPDHRASLLPNELLQLVTQIREVELALGSVEKIPSKTELAVRNLIRRSLTACRDLESGQILKVSDIAILRPGTGIPPSYLYDVVGKKLSRSVREGDTLQWGDLQ